MGDDVKSDPIESESGLFVGAVAKAIRVMEVAAAAGRPMTLAEIATQAKISRSAAQRLAFTLEAAGWLVRGDGGRGFQVTSEVVKLAAGYLSASDLIRAANPFLHQVFAQTGESCQLAVPSGDDVLFVIRHTTPKQLTAFMPVGARIPFYCSASGKVLLAALPEQDMRRRLQGMSLRAYTPTTITDIDRVVAEVEVAREQGFARANGEFFAGDLNVAAAVYRGGEALAAVSISAPASRWDFAEFVHVMAPEVVEAAQAITRTLAAQTLA